MHLITNQHEFRVYGQMRSGNHAIIGWLIDQFAGQRVLFLNNVEHGGADPFATAAQKEFYAIEEELDIETLRAAPKDALIYSYEDRKECAGIGFLQSISGENGEHDDLQGLGESATRHHLLIIRDPFNCLASRKRLIETRGPLGGIKDYDQIASDWVALAHRAISLMERPDGCTIVVPYNRWSKDLEFRKSLSAQIGGTFSDASMKSQAEYGGGSSFTQSSMSVGEAMSKWKKAFSLKRWMNLSHYIKKLTAPPAYKGAMSRWETYAQDPEFAGLFAKYPLLELSEKLFGEIPKTREVFGR